MKKMLYMVIISFCCSACTMHPEMADKRTIQAVDTIKRKEGSLPRDNKKILSDQITGNWALAKSSNTSFVIDSGKIMYPESFSSYPYSIQKDSLYIQYDGYSGRYAIVMCGSDTLILKADETQVYHRIKE